MTHVAVPSNKLLEMLKSLMGEYRLVAPVNDGSSIVFKVVNKAEDIVLDDSIAYKSPKEFLFPQVEQIMVFTKDGGLENKNFAPKTVIFGIRPCDLEAIKVMTAVFTQGKYVDAYFEQKLKNTVLIGLGCKSEKSGCFCAQRGINKGYSNACDLFFTNDGGSFTAEVITDKGESIINRFNFEKVSPPEVKEAETDDVELLEINADENTVFNKIDWGKISEKCIGCGTCTYICPTCHCFAFRDTVENGDAVRYKCWDSCMYPKFTLHASGHNPRASKKERYRQRIMHKYLYVKENFGYTACTGCGRCIRSCPAGMNIKSVISDIMLSINKSENG
jgi:sulfhydrogenase subunit beta (sulfur reductase)